MQVIDILEQDDGSAIVSVDLTKEETHIILQYGFTSMLSESIKNEIEIQNSNMEMEYGTVDE